MKVIVINASPKKDKGITGLILAPFLEGMREAGANVELFYTRDLHIQPCLGKFNCWFRNPGTCCQHDDMDWLRFKYEEADITVFATPLYADGMAGPLKNFVDRLIPFAKPTLELRDGHCRHPLREDFKPGSLALVSNCGFWELDNFDPLLAHIKALSKNVNCQFVGALLRPHSLALTRMLAASSLVKDVLGASKKAGQELVTTGQMSNQTLAIISKPLMPVDTYVRTLNEKIQQAFSFLTID